MANSKTYDQEFSEAMLLKLRLNREARSKASESSVQNNNPSEDIGDFRRSIVKEMVAEHPDLTEEEAIRHLIEAGG